MDERFYVYAIAAPDIRLPDNVTGFGGSLHILPYNELGAIVSRVQVADVGNKTSTTAPSAENLLRHEAVVEAIRASGPALPVRFGTELPIDKTISHTLAAHYDTLCDDLRRIGDKIELGLTVLWHPKGERSSSITPDLGEERQSGADMAGAPTRTGLAYLRKRQAVYQQAESARERAQSLALELDTVLRTYALECHRSVCPSERLALRDVYLLAPDRIGAFESAITEVRQRHLEARFLLSGPWPPYSFVTSPTRDDEKVLQGGKHYNG